MDSDSDDNNGSGSEASHSGSGSESEASLHNESSSSSDDDDSVEQFNVNLQRVRENEFNVNLQRVKVNDPEATELAGNGRYNCIEHMTDEGWEQLGRDISNNTHLKDVYLYEGAMNDHKMSFFYRGLTRSNSIQLMALYENNLSIAGVRSMVPFLQKNNLKGLNISDNDILSEGLNLLFQALSDSPIEDLRVTNCSIESIALASGRLPRNLKHLHLDWNNIKINADGRNGLAKLLQGGHSTLKGLWLSNNKIDNEGVAILVDILRSNTTLTTLALEHNNDITYDGEMLLLKLVNNLSSIKATLQSNHTLTNLTMKEINPYGEYPYQNDLSEEFQMNINVATQINANEGNLVAAGREKVVVSHLDSQIRLELYCLQDLDDSLYSQIDPFIYLRYFR
ncbi:leucine-rich repeat protein [Skeletonema marinoi]|uniref:Leucine-rich repeat protein n=2 Tax=Skeletonema marinoi TaxID=267567 RepID=A0AAD8YHH9_9STRA|nr:leucine-rich repeat protein [Skeletonema marinoi]